MLQLFGTARLRAVRSLRVSASRAWVSAPFVALALTLLIISSSFALAAEPAVVAVDPADAAFLERLIDREVVRSVKASSKAITVRGHAPLVGADDQTLIDVATVALRVHAASGATRVVFDDPSGDEFASFTTAGGLSRTASKKK